MDVNQRHVSRAPFTRSRTDAEVREFLAHLPRYRLWLHDDRHHETGSIARALADAVPVLANHDAALMAEEARAHGRAEVLLCYREQAEHYCERMRIHLLRASIEPE